MKVVARCFLSGTLKAMLTLVLFVFVLVWAELTQWFPQRVFVELSLQCRVICWVYHFCDTVGLCHFWFFANLGLQASQGRTDIVNNTSLHQTRESNIKLQDQALVTRLSHPHARNSGDMSQRPSVADPRNRNSQLSSGESLESQWDLFQKYLKIGKVQDPDPAVQQSALKPPPSKSQKVVSGSWFWLEMYRNHFFSLHYLGQGHVSFLFEDGVISAHPICQTICSCVVTCLDMCFVHRDCKLQGLQPIQSPHLWMTYCQVWVVWAGLRSRGVKSFLWMPQKGRDLHDIKCPHWQTVCGQVVVHMNLLSLLGFAPFNTRYGAGIQ